MRIRYRIVPSAEKGAVTRYGHTGHGDIVFRDQLVSTLVLAQVPDANISSTVTADQLALVWMNDDVVDGNSVRVIALDTRGTGIPDLDGAIFGASDHPFPLAVKGYAGDVAGVTFEGEDGVRIRGLDVIKLDVLIPRSCEIALVGRDAKTVHLRAGVRNGTLAYSRQCLPEAGLC
jgi:hypothetical protein